MGSKICTVYQADITAHPPKKTHKALLVFRKHLRLRASHVSLDARFSKLQTEQSTTPKELLRESAVCIQEALFCLA